MVNFELEKRKLKIKVGLGGIFAVVISLLIYNQMWLLGLLGMIVFNRIYKI